MSGQTSLYNASFTGRQLQVIVVLYQGITDSTGLETFAHQLVQNTYLHRLVVKKKCMKLYGYIFGYNKVEDNSQVLSTDILGSVHVMINLFN